MGDDEALYLNLAITYHTYYLSGFRARRCR